jgi:hypothetical protein
MWEFAIRTQGPLCTKENHCWTCYILCSTEKTVSTYLVIKEDDLFNKWLLILGTILMVLLKRENIVSGFLWSEKMSAVQKWQQMNYERDTKDPTFPTNSHALLFSGLRKWSGIRGCSDQPLLWASPFLSPTQEECSDSHLISPFYWIITKSNQMFLFLT